MAVCYNQVVLIRSFHLLINKLRDSAPAEIIRKPIVTTTAANGDITLESKNATDRERENNRRRHSICFLTEIEILMPRAPARVSFFFAIA